MSGALKRRDVTQKNPRRSVENRGFDQPTKTLIASGAAVRRTRALMRGSATATLADQLEQEQRSLVDLAGSDAVITGLRRMLKLD